MRNGSVTPSEEGFAKQAHGMLLGGWSTEDVASSLGADLEKLEPWVRRYSWKKVPQIYIAIS